MSTLSTSYLSDLRQRLGRWFDEHARDLPWRRTSDPYAIWLSEVILQQTQVVQGLAYYERFLNSYPSIEALSRASEDDVLRLWQGLGYYSRGRNLLKAAQMMASEFGGRMPSTLEEIRRLPGVGPYTQAAVLSFAYGLPYATVDGNVYRVLSRLFADPTPIDRPEGRKRFAQLADELLDREYPGRHNQAVIELGALVCRPQSPLCSECPIGVFCQAFAEGRQTDYPKKVGRLSVQDRYLNYFLVLLPEASGERGRGREILIRRRGKGDIWQGLYELPLIETAKPESLEEILEGEAWQELSASLQGERIHLSFLSERAHRLTHRLLHARLYLVEADDYLSRGEADAFLRIPLEDRGAYGMPALIDKMLSAWEGDAPPAGRDKKSLQSIRPRRRSTNKTKNQ